MINANPGDLSLQNMMERRMTLLGLLLLPAAAGAAGPDPRPGPAKRPPSGDQLVATIQRLEDDRQIRQLIDLHWLLADAGPNAAFVDLYTEDCVIDYARLLNPDADTIVEGRAAIRARYVESPQGPKGRSHHLSAGPQPICITGDEAQSVTNALVSS
jgi:hypothetical protein